MDTTTSKPPSWRNRANFASLIAGGLALVLSVFGQLLAAHRLATDWNSGHPSANQDSMHALLVAPGMIVAYLALGLGAYACGKSKSLRGYAIAGIALSLVAIGATLTNFPGEFATDQWITIDIVDE